MTELLVAAPGTDRAPVRRLPRPRPPVLLGSDVWTVAIFVVAVTLGLWWRSSGPAQFGAGTVGVLQALGQLTGLTAALAALAALVLTARPGLLERRFGLDGLLAAHRWLGIVTVSTLLVHAVADTLAWAMATRQGPIAALVDLMAHESWMVAAVVGTVVFLIAGISSWRRLRQRLSYETWYFLHTLGYLAVLLGFGHQLTLGTDIAGSTLAWWWWVGLAAVAAVVIAWSRLGGLFRAAHRRLYVSAVSTEATRTRSIHVSGPGLAHLRVASGQFFLMRALTPGLWWQAHPLSVSAAPTTAGLRFTVKELGDDTPALVRLRPGTRVVLEGPYGVFTAEQAEGRKVVLVAGGVGIAPIRALLEDLRPEQEPVVIVRVHDERDLAHRIELERLVASRQGRLVVLAGPRSTFSASQPFAPASLRALLPDVADRHAFVCGPPSLTGVVRSGLRRAGMPAAHIHYEDFGV